MQQPLLNIPAKIVGIIFDTKVEISIIKNLLTVKKVDSL